MNTVAVLTSKPLLRFNPLSPEHRAAYWRLRHTGKQDPDLRFLLEEGYSSVLTMMQAKLADYACQSES